MSEPPLLRVRDLRVEFTVGRGPRWLRRETLRAVDDVSLDLPTGQTVAVVGESGSGKSTMARALLRLVPARQGVIELDGQQLPLDRPLPREIRRRMQMVFQDPYSSLDPSMVVADIVGEPLEVHERLSKRECRERVVEALEQVGLNRHHLHRYPNEFSGGQRQRIAIARAIVMRPDLVICDEPVSALDVSTQSQIINLLRDLQRNQGVSYLFIGHDLAVVRNISARVAVMYVGQIVENGPTERVYRSPGHPYTAALLSAVPYPHPVVQHSRKRIILSGEIPSPTRPPSGCRFHTRCPFAMEICSAQPPRPHPVDGGGYAACHLHDHGPELGGGSVLPLVENLSVEPVSSVKP